MSPSMNQMMDQYLSSVYPYTCRQRSSIAPYLESSKISYWNLLQTKQRFTSMVRWQIDKLSLPLVVLHLVRLPWFSFNFLICSSTITPMVRRFNDGPLIASIDLVFHYFQFFLLLPPEHLSCKTRHKLVKITTIRL